MLPAHVASTGRSLPAFQIQSFSPVAVKALQILRTPGVSMKELAAIIGADPALTASMLRLANSSTYQRRLEIHSVLQALCIVGLERTTRLLIMAALWRSVHGRSDDPLVKMIWRHCLASAVLAERLVTYYPAEPSVYTLGLLHGMGQMAMIQSDPARYRGMLERAEDDQLPIAAAEHITYGAEHHTVTGLLFEGWNLPLLAQDLALSQVVPDACRAAHGLGFGGCLAHPAQGESVEIPEHTRQLIAAHRLAEYVELQINVLECSLL